ncbi:putative sodium-dependent excitatory amino acid transporter glt-6, partial [Stegodyphus mimosarum]
MSGEIDQRKEDKSKPQLHEAKVPRRGCGSRFMSWVRENGFLVLLVLATASGYILGFLLKPQNFSSQTITLIGFPGQLVIRSFLMIIVPLLFCNLVLGVSSLRKGGDAKMVAITIAFFLGLSTFSAIMGATAGHVVHPGQKITSSKIQPQSSMSGRKGVILDSMLDLLWNGVPSNIIEATFVKEYTHVEIVNTSSSGTLNGSVIYKKSLQQKKG